ncbi:MAG: SpoIID/LytB domain-containing protein [Solirubrobacteraceae bacterium]
MRLRTSLIAALLTLAAAAPADADAASRLIVRGGGFGHGIGMSQYGTLGFAKQGRDYRFILGHYYSGTQLGRLSSSTQVRVLVQTASRVSFSGATDVPGSKTLDPSRTYRATRKLSGGVTLRTTSGSVVGNYASPLTIVGSAGGIRLRGRSANGVTNGRYRGRLQLRPSALGGLNAINQLNLEHYVRGVVAGESPASWPAHALRAQAVAARTYAITTSKSGPGFDQYSDTRSQVYNGIAGERANTNAAVAATRGEVVTYDGEPVVTYYFSTSGGRTENIEYAFVGAEPKPWLRSVADPYDDESPHHTWVVRMSLGQAKQKLGGLVRGGLRRIRVLKRGRSPRVVRAEIIGTKGRRRTTGPVLRTRLGLLATWARFTVITAGVSRGDGSARTAAPRGGAATGSAARTLARVLATAGTISGRVSPPVKGSAATVQRRYGRSWVTLYETPTGGGGRYRAPVYEPGLYRIAYAGEAGPPVRVR